MPAQGRDAGDELSNLTFGSALPARNDAREDRPMSARCAERRHPDSARWTARPFVAEQLPATAPADTWIVANGSSALRTSGGWNQSCNSLPGHAGRSRTIRSGCEGPAAKRRGWVRRISVPLTQPLGEGVQCARAHHLGRAQHLPDSANARTSSRPTGLPSSSPIAACSSSASAPAAASHPPPALSS